MKLLSALRSPLVFILALSAYLLVARDLVYRPSIAPYFINLAEAFVDGKVEINIDGTSTYDLIYREQKWFVAQPPLPSMMLVPFMLVYDRPSDVMLGVLLGATSVMLCERVLQTSMPQLSWWRRALLVAFFAFGTAHLYLATMGTVWFLGQTSAVLALWLFIQLVLARRPVVAGLALALVLLARPSIGPGALIFALLYWWEDGQKLIARLVALLLPVVLSITFLGAYNALRFGDPLEFGYGFINDSSAIKERRETFGSFSLAFLPDNLYTATLKPPREFNLGCLTNPDCGVITPDLWGMGLLWTSPLLLAGLLSPRDRLFWAVALGSALIMLPSLLYHNSGSAQFGYRFSLDALPLWLLAVARVVQAWPVPLLVPTVTYSLILNVIGTLWLMGQIIPPLK
ncbi:MAG: hypothetical protein NZ750_10765 [Anaerolineae bacterium]|nr:hypothetical protein [Anaerolineae bacterium]MDW8171544.1 hypothetical protein [Anaerolineae bacterium]